MKRAFVLLSGGMDSTVCLHKAIADLASSVESVSINYGQNHSREIGFAQRTCRKFGIKHTTLTIPTMESTDATFYVPFRNGLFLSMMTAHAQRWIKEQTQISESRESFEDSAAIYFGPTGDDIHFDSLPEFIGAMANAIHAGTSREVRLRTPLQWLSKGEIVLLGERLGVDWSNTYSCYMGGERHCGKCHACQARRNGFRFADVADPTEYET